jgi:predicted ArsR family transcriptional regulator
VKIPGWRQRFQASSRGKILALLRAESRTVNQLAEALQLTESAVRSHLISLERDGLIQQLGMRRGFRKPHVLYGLTPEAEHLFPTAYGSLLRHALTVFGRHYILKNCKRVCERSGARLRASISITSKARRIINGLSCPECPQESRR